MPNHNRDFFGHVTLALALAGWVAVFGIPVCSRRVFLFVFGARSAAVGEGCDVDDMGWKARLAGQPDLWCGFLSQNYIVWWPNVVQTAVFTVYRNTGTTIKLAWQCVCGTLTATLNMVLLSCLFPQGALSENYMPWVAWLDLVVVLFLYLASRADINTMRMGMTWTVNLMMKFMDPVSGPTMGHARTFIPGINADADTTCVLLTSLAGCILAILATLVPRALTNFKNLRNEAMDVEASVGKCVQEALAYYTGGQLTPKRFKFYAMIRLLTSKVTAAEKHLEDTYWETFNVHVYGRSRALYRSFCKTVRCAEDEIYCIKQAIDHMDFNPQQRDMASHMKESLEEIVKGALCLLECCAGYCHDGRISEEETAALRTKIDEMAAKQIHATTQYRKFMDPHPYICKDMAPDNLLIFSISQWARHITGFAMEVAEFENKWQGVAKGGPLEPVVQLARVAWHQFFHVFNLRSMFSTDQLHFTVVNGIPILATYIMAMYIPPGSLVVKYSNTMVCTLTLLTSTAFGSTFFTNLQQLLGVTFGNVLPLLTAFILRAATCESSLHSTIQFMTTFCFYMAFCFMYYASDQWATVGVNVAAFGAPFLLLPCSDDNSAHYATRYKDIAQVIIAILLKMFVAQVLSKAEPRDVALEKFGTLMKEVRAAYDAFFRGNLNEDGGLLPRRVPIRNLLQECEEIAPTTDPQLHVVPGSRLPFRYRLFIEALKVMRHLVSDLDILAAGLEGYKEEETLDINGDISGSAGYVALADKDLDSILKAEEDQLFQLMQKQPSYAAIREDVTSTMDAVFAMTFAVLSSDSGEPIDPEIVEKLIRIAGIMDMEGLGTFYQEISADPGANHQSRVAADLDKRPLTQLRRTRHTVAINALALSVRHLGELAATSFQNMPY